MAYIKVFAVGGSMCVIAQILMAKTKLTPARILVLYVILGAILGSVGIYEKLIDFAGAGATVPIPGFGNLLAKSVINEVNERGLIGAFLGGLRGASAGLTGAIFFGYIMAAIFNSKSK